MSRSEIYAYIIKQTEEDIILLDNFDDAFVGLTCDENTRSVYSVNKIIEILSEEMEEEDAWDYFHYNIEGSHVGEKTPVYIRTI